jgi:hypothetical protein
MISAVREKVRTILRGARGPGDFVEPIGDSLEIGIDSAA